jgi:hypothetical protein
VQGKTLSSVLIADVGLGARGTNMKEINRGLLYVMITRVRSWKNLFLLREVPTDYSKYIPRYDVMEETNRLRRGLYRQSAMKLIDLGCETPEALPPMDVPSRPDSTRPLKSTGATSSMLVGQEGLVSCFVLSLLRCRWRWYFSF